MLKPKVVPLREAHKYIGQLVEVKGVPRYIKTLSDGKEGYVIKGEGGKIICASPEKLDGKPVLVRGRIKKVYGIVYLDVEKPSEIKPVPKKGFAGMRKEVLKKEIPERAPEKIKLMITPSEVEKIERHEVEKKGIFTRLKRFFGKPRKPEKKLPPPPPPSRMMLPEEKKIRIMKEAERKKEKQKLKPPELIPHEKHKKGFLEKIGLKKAKAAPKPKEIKPTGGFLGKLKLGKPAPPLKPPTKPVPKPKVIVKKPEELEHKKVLLEKIKKEVPKKKVVVEKIQEVEKPLVAVSKVERPEEIVVEKKVLKLKPKEEKVKVEKTLPTKILGPQKIEVVKEKPEAEELEEPTKIVSEIKQIARTPIDHMLEIVKERGSVDISALSSEMNVPENVIENWARILEEHKLLSLEYPPIGKPRLVVYEAKKKNKG